MKLMRAKDDKKRYERKLASLKGRVTSAYHQTNKMLQDAKIRAQVAQEEWNRIEEKTRKVADGYTQMHRFLAVQAIRSPE